MRGGIPDVKDTRRRLKRVKNCGKVRAIPNTCCFAVAIQGAVRVEIALQHNLGYEGSGARDRGPLETAGLISGRASSKAGHPASQRADRPDAFRSRN